MTSVHTLAPMADHLAAKLIDTRAPLRDVIDQMTYGQYDCQPLDILTDMVARRIFNLRAKRGQFGRATVSAPVNPDGF